MTLSMLSPPIFSLLKIQPYPDTVCLHLIISQNSSSTIFSFSILCLFLFFIILYSIFLFLSISSFYILFTPHHLLFSPLKILKHSLFIAFLSFQWYLLNHFLNAFFLYSCFYCSIIPQIWRLIPSLFTHSPTFSPPAPTRPITTTFLFYCFCEIKINNI